MGRMAPRVVYFPDSFHEVNGVAHTSRNFEAFAKRRGLPFLCVRAGNRAQAFVQESELRTLELGRSGMAVGLEQDLKFDPLFFRYRDLISKTVREFRPDVIHITGPSELGMFGAYFAWKLGVPLAASWHTNVHEYAGRRLQWLTRNLGELGVAMEHGAEVGTLDVTSRFYRLAKVLYAPNPELCALLERKTGRPCHLMQRGVETELFTPAKRTRGADGKLVLGDGDCGAVVDCGAWRGGGDVAEGFAYGGVCGGVARGGVGRGLREYGLAGVSVAHGYVWECGVGSAGEWGSGDCDSGWWPGAYCAGWGDGEGCCGCWVCAGDCGDGVGVWRDERGGSGVCDGVFLGCGV